MSESAPCAPVIKVNIHRMSWSLIVSLPLSLSLSVSLFLSFCLSLSLSLSVEVLSLDEAKTQALFSGLTKSSHI